MTTSNDTTGCAERSQKLAILGGAILGVLSSLSIGLFVGIGVGVVSWMVLRTVLVKVLCPEGSRQSAEAAPVAAEPVAEAAPEPAPAAVAPTVEEAPAEEPAPTAASTLVKPSKSLPGQEELAARKGTWKYEGNPAS